MATGRTLGVQVTRGAVHAAFFSLLWRLSALHDVEHPEGRDVEALAVARSTFTGQLEAILDSTELVCLAFQRSLLPAAPTCAMVHPCCVPWEKTEPHDYSCNIL